MNMVIVPLNMMIMMMDANTARAVLLPVRSVALYMHPQYSTYTS